MMKCKAIKALVILVAALAFAAPTLFSIQLAHKEAIDAETQRVMDYARDVLRRSDRAARQINDGLERLHNLGEPPCSPASLDLMRQIDFIASQIQVVGHVAGGRLVCSSLGLHEPGIPLPPPDSVSVTHSGTTVRTNVELPIAPGFLFTLVERYGFVAVIHRDLPIDTTTQDHRVALATFSPEGGRLRSFRGPVRLQWLGALGDRDSVSFVDDGYMVAIVRSQQFSSGALAALPVSALDSHIEYYLRRLIPVGILAGALLALAIFWLAHQQAAMPTLLKSALRREEFHLLYQPIVDLRTGQWVGAEALIRWQRDSGEQIRPDIFIPVAEDNGLILRLTRQLVRLATRDAEDLFRQFPDFHLSLNLSAADLHSLDTVTLIERMVSETGAAHGNLLIEATERGFLDPASAREVVSQLRKLGVQVAVDDFGTGYSSLSYLESFELDYLKIDKSFVDTMGTEAATSQVVLHIIQMANALELEMIAEGVETQEQADALTARGVQYAQGWLFGKPMPMAELRAQLTLQQRALHKAAAAEA